MAFSNAGVEHHLQQHITKLIRQVIRILLINGADGFPRLFNQVSAKRFMGLGTIPRAAVFSTENAHDLLQVCKAIPLPILEGCRRYIDAARMVILLLPIQIFKGKELRLKDRLVRRRKEDNGHFIIVQIRKPQLYVTGQNPVVDFRNHQGRTRIRDSMGAIRCRKNPQAFTAFFCRNSGQTGICCRQSCIAGEGSTFRAYPRQGRNRTVR